MPNRLPMKTEAQIWAIIPAAGRGRRMGGDTPKQYLPLAGKSVIAHTLECFARHPRIAGIVVAIAPDDVEWSRHAAAVKDKALHVVEGGAERCHSVLNALRLLSDQLPESAWVMVHDAARPCLHADDITRLIGVLRNDPVGGLLAVPVSDTLKRSDSDQRGIGTIERAGLWRALTPQMFRLGLLLSALESSVVAGELPTDEAAAIEAAGDAPRLVEGRVDNIKITTRADLILAEAVLAAR